MEPASKHLRTEKENIEVENGLMPVPPPQAIDAIKPSQDDASPQFDVVGGHADSIVFESSIAWKKLQDKGRGDRELKFIKEAASVLGLRDFVPKFQGERTIDNTNYVGMNNLLAGLKEPAIIDLKMGTQTWSPFAPADKIARASAKAASTTTAKIGVRLVGGKIRLEPGGDWVWMGYRNGEDLRTEDEFENQLGRFLCSPALRKQAATHIENLLEWFEIQREFAFYGSSLLLAYDTCALPNPEELRFGMIDFAHVETPPEGGDQSYITGLQSMRRMITNLNSQA